MKRGSRTPQGQESRWPLHGSVPGQLTVQGGDHTATDVLRKPRAGHRSDPPWDRLGQSCRAQRKVGMGID